MITTFVAVLASFLVLAAGAVVLRAVLATSPWRTVAVNSTGSLVMGLIAAHGALPFMVLAVAGMGSLTTFSGLVAHVADPSGNHQQRLGLAMVGVLAPLVGALVGLELGE